MKDKIFVVPKNDLESVEIIGILKECGYKENVDLFITNQPKDASWDGLEPDIKNILQNKKDETVEVTRYENPSTPLTLDTPGTWSVSKNVHNDNLLIRNTQWIEMDSAQHAGTYREYLEEENFSTMSEDFHKTEFERSDKIAVIDTFAPPIYGVELKGDPPYENAKNIDHHKYIEKDTAGNIIVDDRTCSDSSLHQVANLLNKKLTIEQRLAAANDVGSVHEMEHFGSIIGMNRQLLLELMKETLMKEYAIFTEVRDITPEMEQQAIDAVENATFTERGCMVVHLPHNECVAVINKVPGQDHDGGLLIICGDGEINYYGHIVEVNQLDKRYEGLVGDPKETHTFWKSKDIPEEDLINVIDHKAVLEKESFIGSDFLETGKLNDEKDEENKDSSFVKNTLNKIRAMNEKRGSATVDDFDSHALR